MSERQEMVEGPEQMKDRKKSREDLFREIEELRARVALLEKCEKQWRQWFEDAPVSLWVSRDITDRKKAEVERAELEAQNRQLQKAESLGRSRVAWRVAEGFT